MKATLFYVAGCLLFTSIAAQNQRAVDRLVEQIQNVARDLEACQAASATTTQAPFSTTEEFGSNEDESTTPGDLVTEGGSNEGMPGNGSGENEGGASKRDVGRVERAGRNGILRELRTQLRFLRRELNKCEEALDD